MQCTVHRISALAPDFSQHGNMRAVSQDMGNKVTGITYLKKYLRYFILNKKIMRYLKKVLRIWLHNSRYL